MNRLHKLLALALPLALTTGCFRMTMYSPVEQPEDRDLKKIFIDFDEHAKWHHAVLFGMIDIGATNVTEQCPDGVAKVHSRGTFLNALATIATFQLYAPQVNNVLCADSGAKAAPSDAEGEGAADESDAAEEGAAEEGAAEEGAAEEGGEEPAE